MRDEGFKDIVSDDMTLEVMKRIHPNVDEQSIEREGIRSYLYGVLQSDNFQDSKEAIEVYCWFDAEGKRLGLMVGPDCRTSLESEDERPSR